MLQRPFSSVDRALPSGGSGRGFDSHNGLSVNQSFARCAMPMAVLAAAIASCLLLPLTSLTGMLKHEGHLANFTDRHAEALR
eukprot:19576-Heterococcus_DN1.PRE.2